MNFDALKVVIRTQDRFISARLELESQRAFAVIYESETRDTKAVVGSERLELDTQFLQKMNDTEYLYKTQIELPMPGRSGLVRPVKAESQTPEPGAKSVS